MKSISEKYRWVKINILIFVNIQAGQGSLFHYDFTVDIKFDSSNDFGLEKYF